MARLRAAGCLADPVALLDTVRQTVRTVIGAGSGGPVSPDDMTIGPDGMLYVTTQGSVAANDGSVSFGFGFESQILRDDAMSRESDPVMIARMPVDMLHTPVHTPACMTHVIGNAAFLRRQAVHAQLRHRALRLSRRVGGGSVRFRTEDRCPAR